jgi:L-aspartate oxidase
MKPMPVIIGGGAAGLMAALCLAPREVLVLCGGAFGGGAASGWAQGGIAAAIGADDSVALHVADTIAAGAGLCDPASVERIVACGPWAIEKLLSLGARFDDGLGLEAAHTRRRIIHAKDATGAEIMRVLLAAVQASPGIRVIEHARATGLAVADNAVQGVQFRDPSGIQEIASNAVIIATGGVGGLFADTTNPLGAVGAGLALAARAGAVMRDMEFVQFHPTALACGLDPMPLISEALRGEGAVFVDDAGDRFMQGQDLAARDVVARAVAAKYAEGDKVFLDARGVSGAKFPAVFAICRANGIDPSRTPIPVRPAAHYHMGGIAVNAECESSIAGLFACGEAACTGLHGANRLASNSLLEAIITGRDAAAAIAKRVFAPAPNMQGLSAPVGEADSLAEIRQICAWHLGIVRSANGIERAIARLDELTPVSDAAFVAKLIAEAAWRRQESRGAHLRRDFPAADAAFARSATSHLVSEHLKFAA